MNSRAGFNFGNLIDSAASSVTDLAGGNDTVASLAKQASNVSKAVDSGDASQIVSAAGGSIAANVGGDAGQTINQVSSLGSGIADSAQNNDPMGLVGGSIGTVGTLAGGQDGATIQNIG